MPIAGGGVSPEEVSVTYAEGLGGGTLGPGSKGGVPLVPKPAKQSGSGQLEGKLAARPRVEPCTRTVATSLGPIGAATYMY